MAERVPLGQGAYQGPAHRGRLQETVPHSGQERRVDHVC